MKNNLVRLKLKQRLNKLASSDYTNLECWQEVELLNKACTQWVRRQLHGTNSHQEGDESSKRRIDDLNILLKDKELKGSNRGEYFETSNLPEDYLEFKKVVVVAKQDGCEKKKKIRTVLVEEANVDWYMGDHLRQPSFKWGETFSTIFGDKVRVWTNDDFTVIDCKLTYYKQPRKINFEGCADYEGVMGTDVEFEFKDDIVELIIDEAVSIASGDTQDFNNMQRSKQSVEEDN